MLAIGPANLTAPTPFFYDGFERQLCAFGACAERVAGYRQALVRLCNELEMSVLITDAGNELREWPVEGLDEWLRPTAP